MNNCLLQLYCIMILYARTWWRQIGFTRMLLKREHIRHSDVRGFLFNWPDEPK
jgi:hypothetical protein